MRHLLKRFFHGGRCRSLVCVAAAVLGGCRGNGTPEDVFSAPPIDTGVRQFAGTALTGPLPLAADSEAQGLPWGVSARIVVVSNLPGDAFQLLGPQARLVIGGEGGGLLSPSTRLIYTARYRAVDASQPLESSIPPGTLLAEIKNFAAAVVVGSTASFEMQLSNQGEDQKPASRRLAVQVYREAAGSEYEFALSSSVRVTGSAAPTSSGEEKLVILRKIDGQSDRLLLWLPMKFSDPHIVGILIDLKVDTANSDPSVVNEMKRDVAAHAQEAAGRVTRTNASPQELTLLAAMDAVTTGSAKQELRPALSFLARESGAKLSEHVILAADDSVLQLIQAKVRERAAQLPDRQRATVSWMLDRATVEAVASIKEDETTGVLSPIVGALTIYAGEVGRQLDVLQSLVKQSVNSEDLYARITAEQQIGLEDSSPAVRVRAYDWLNEHGAGPADYDPLGSPVTRRAAVEKYRDVQATQPSIAK